MTALRAQVRQIAPDARLRNHEHSVSHLMVVLDGSLRELLAKTSVDLGPGSIRVSPPTRHSLDFSPAGARCLLLPVPAGPLAELGSSCFLPAEPRLRALASRLAFALEAGGPAARLRSLDFEGELLAQIDRQRRGCPDPAPGWLRKVRDKLRRAPGLRAEVLADEAEVHRVHLSRAFREHFGCSFGEYARRQRLLRALPLIEDLELSLAEVAIEAGFADQAHLTRSARKALGVTPGSLRVALSTS